MDGDERENHVRDWSELSDDALEVITHRSDMLSLSRFSYVIPDLLRSLERVAIFFPYDLPCLLREGQYTWPSITAPQDTDVTIMPLDKPPMRETILFTEDVRWVGYRQNWLAILTYPARLDLTNFYTGTTILVPSIEHARFKRYGAYREFYVTYRLGRSKLLKIHISAEPLKLGSDWSYSLIALFDRLIAFICPGENDEWIVLKDSNLAPRL
jgi:hypothetical protein